MRQKLFFEDAFEAAYEKSTLGTLIIVLCKHTGLVILPATRRTDNFEDCGRRKEKCL